MPQQRDGSAGRSMDARGARLLRAWQGTTALSIVALIVIGTYAYYLRAQNTRIFHSEYPLIDPARSLVSQSNFFTTVQPLRDQMDGIVTQYEARGDKVGVFFEFLNTGATIAINQDERFWPASLSKLPTALEVMKKAEDGDWQLSDQLVLFDQDKSSDFGALYEQPTGTKFSIEDLLKALLIQSDDTAHRILIRNTTAGDFEELTSALGLQDFYNNDYDINAKEYSRLFTSLYSASYLNRSDSSLLLSWLTETPFNDFLQSGMPSGVTFAHKIGIQDPRSTYLDSGIVYVPERPYILTVMVDSSATATSTEAKQIMRDLSKAAYDFVANH